MPELRLRSGGHCERHFMHWGIAAVAVVAAAILCGRSVSDRTLVKIHVIR